MSHFASGDRTLFTSFELFLSFLPALTDTAFYFALCLNVLFMVYLEPCQKTMMEIICANSFTKFTKRLNQIYLAASQIRLCSPACAHNILPFDIFNGNAFFWKIFHFAVVSVSFESFFQLNISICFYFYFFTSVLFRTHYCFRFF